VKAPEGWAAVTDRGTVLAIDVRLTAALKQEGMARETVRHIQNLRKEAGLELEDRIDLYLATEAPDLQAALRAHRDAIAAETLVRRWSPLPLGSDDSKSDVKVHGQPLHIELRKHRND
jgi:isoleucyl-tRNA synthetase